MWREKGEETNWGWEEGGGQETVKGSEDEWLVACARQQSSDDHIFRA